VQRIAHKAPLGRVQRARSPQAATGLIHRRDPAPLGGLMLHRVNHLDTECTDGTGSRIGQELLHSVEKFVVGPLSQPIGIC